MNSTTLIGSLIFAAVLALVIALVISLMVRGWRHRGERQAALIGALPEVPETVGSAIVAPTSGIYVGCTLAPRWHDRVAVGDLGYRSKAVLTRYPEGILVQRSKASPIWIPQESITAIRTERGMVGKVTTRDGILAIRWRLPSGAEIDTGFRGDDRSQYHRWLPEAC
ncbi:PH-like domain-containing protein [Mycobacterium noviomagense]|uniref:Transporter n=1 Tax=Mycobacterium noviomagense TaxID=459858 RepID=A0ABX3T999_9MYCO|nr:transporter [Mycobacterium noviomagense]ORB17377.1 transporter [Mycobacterium noviomagense]